MAETDSEVLKPGKIGGLETSSISDIDVPNLNLLIYGDSGSGKTFLAGSAGEIDMISPVLFIDIEAGSLTLKKLDKKVSKNIHVVRVAKWSHLQKVYDQLYESNNSGKNSFPYKAVVIDSLTEAQKLGMQHILGTEAKFPGSVLFDSDQVPEIRDWGKNTEQIRRLTRAFRDLNCTTIFTALATEKIHGKGLPVKWPLFTNKLADEIPGLFDAVFYLYVKETKGKENQRFLLTDKTSTALAKSRLLDLPIVMEEPKLMDIYSIYDSKVDSK